MYSIFGDFTEVLNSLEGIDEQLTPSTAKFEDKDGKETTVFNYYNTKYLVLSIYFIASS
jgi:hypothetical protein